MESRSDRHDREPASPREARSHTAEVVAHVGSAPVDDGLCAPREVGAVGRHDPLTLQLGSDRRSRRGLAHPPPSRPLSTVETYSVERCTSRSPRAALARRRSRSPHFCSAGLSRAASRMRPRRSRAVWITTSARRLEGASTSPAASSACRNGSSPGTLATGSGSDMTGFGIRRRRATSWCPEARCRR